MISSIIKQRVSIRKYQDRPVPEEEIRNILRAAMQAPSACDQQPWEFYVITDKDMIKKLARTSPYAGCADFPQKTCGWKRLRKVWAWSSSASRLTKRE